jgi:hypothetical protein
MATGRLAKATGRAKTTEEQIRDALADGDTRKVLHLAIGALESEAKKRRDRHAGTGALIDVELAALICATAAQLVHHRPSRPPGCPRVPRPADLTRAFDLAITGAREETTDAA